MTVDNNHTLFEKANALHAQGELEQACTQYKQIIAHNAHAPSFFQMGIIALKTRQFNEAIILFKKASEIDPTCADYYHYLAESYTTIENYEQSIAYYNKALALSPENTEYCFRLGLMYHLNRQPEQAIPYYQKTLALEPNIVAVMYHHALATFEIGDHNKAIALYHELLEKNPTHAQAHNNLGTLYIKKNDTEKAIAHYTKATHCDPDYTDAYHNLGLAYKTANELDTAITYYEIALNKQPNNINIIMDLSSALLKMRKTTDVISILESVSESGQANDKIYFNLGLALSQNYEYEKAIAAYKRSLERNNKNAKTYCFLAKIYFEINHFDEAKQHCQKALSIDDQMSDAYLILGKIEEKSGNLTSAINFFQQAHQCEPNMGETIIALIAIYLTLNAWNKAKLFSKKLKALASPYDENMADIGLDPFTALTLQFPLDEQAHIAHNWAKLHTPKTKKYHYTVPRKQVKKLKIGYISPDFYGHPVGLLVNDLFSYHDKKRFHISAYSLNHIDDNHQKTIEKSCDQFHNISNFSYSQAITRIADDNIHILVDLAGYTDRSRPQILAAKPAPIQAHFLGYPNTLGADFMDYHFTLEIMTPPPMQKYYKEKLVYLPETYMATSPFSEIPSLKRSDYGLPNDDTFVFCCFNNSYRIDEAVFTSWMRILNAAPDSVLWLVEHSSRQKEYLLTAAKKHGIITDRLIFATKETMTAHWRHSLADLWLDTFTFSSGTAGILCAWAGLPMLTLKGDLPQNRTGAGVCYALGHTQYIASSIADYEQKAIALAADPNALRHDKKNRQLKAQQSPIFQPERFARHLEYAYERFWEHFVNNSEPEAFTIPPQKNL